MSRLKMISLKRWLEIIRERIIELNMIKDNYRIEIETKKLQPLTKICTIEKITSGITHIEYRIWQVDGVLRLNETLLECNK